MNVNSKDSVKQRFARVLYVVFGGQFVSIGAGFAAYHYRLLHALQSAYTQQQTEAGLVVIGCATTALCIFAVARRLRPST